VSAIVDTAFDFAVLGVTSGSCELGISSRILSEITDEIGFSISLLFSLFLIGATVISVVTTQVEFA
jgi:hypothetical protein